MIQAKELRIGDYLQSETEAWGSSRSKLTYIKVESINNDGINISTGYDGCIEHEYSFDVFLGKPPEGIPLTPEILEKCGFVKTLSGSYTIMDEDCWLTTIIGGYNYSKCYSSNTGEFFEVGQVKYLHQLQNLYFALTGEELNIQL